MKTTFVIDDVVMRRLKEESARRGQTMSALVEAALRRLLDERPDGEPADLEPLPHWTSGGLLVDVSDRDALYEAMEGR